MYVVDVDPMGWPGEFVEGQGGDVGAESSGGHWVMRLERRGVRGRRCSIPQRGRFFGEALFIVGQAALEEAGYPVGGGFPQGTGLSVEGQHFEVVGSRPVWGSDGIYYWELLGVLPERVITATLEVDAGENLAGQQLAGEAAIFTLDVAGDPAGEWRFGLERLDGGVWSLAGGAAMGTAREFSITEGASTWRYRGVGELRDGGYYVTNEVVHQWV